MYDKLVQLTKPFISPLELQGMHGRVLVHPPRTDTTNEILFIYGIHGSLERFYGIIYYLARFGRVTTPDLPGFGDMEPFYKIGKRPNFDAYADYLAEFISKHYGKKTIKIVGLSYGFAVATRMLQRHPELIPQVSLLVSVVGITDGRDISASGITRFGIRCLLWIAKTRPFGIWMQYITTRSWMLSIMYRENHPKMRAIAPEDRPGFIAFEQYLWRCNDMRTYGECMLELLRLRQPNIQIATTVHHIGTKADHWLDDVTVIEHMKMTYQTVDTYTSGLTNHGGTAYDSEVEAKEMIPQIVADLLEKHA